MKASSPILVFFLLGISWLLPAHLSCAVVRQSTPASGAGGPGTSIENATNVGQAAQADAESVQLNVLVTDAEGSVVPGLAKSNFRVLDRGKPQEVVSLASSSAPLTVVLLVEYSSHSYGYFADKAADWAQRFLGQLKPADWVALITFDMRSTVQVDFTHSRFEVGEKLKSLGPPKFGEANLFDALLETLDKLEPVRGRKSIVLLTTGSNTFSAAVFGDVLKRLRGTDVAIFSIGLAEGEAVRYGSSGRYALHRNFLHTFSDTTGALAFFPRFEGELPDVFSSVAGFLRNEYLLSFRPVKANRDGRFHKLRVEVVGADGRPLRIKDKKGRLRAVDVYAREGYVALPASQAGGR